MVIFLIKDEGGNFQGEQPKNITICITSKPIDDREHERNNNIINPKEQERRTRARRGTRMDRKNRKSLVEMVNLNSSISATTFNN